MKRQSGFTLIELVAVIVILGILAAAAVPRFANIQKEARVTKLRAMEGAMNTAVALVYATANARAGQGEVDGCTVGAGGTGNIKMGGVCIEVVNFYPKDSKDGIVAAALSVPLNVGDADLVAKGYAYDNAPSTDHGFMVLGGAGTSGTGGSTINTTCKVEYDEAPAGGTPTVGPVTTTGC